MPRTPRAAPTPAPNAAVGYAAALAVATGAEERAALADRDGVRTPDRLVELRPTEVALRVPTEVMVIGDDADGVGVGLTEPEAAEADADTEAVAEAG